MNAAVHSNNQVEVNEQESHECCFQNLSKKAVVVLSNCEVRDCGGAGLKAEEGSTLNLLNCQVQISLLKERLWILVGLENQSSYVNPNGMMEPQRRASK